MRKKAIAKVSPMACDLFSPHCSCLDQQRPKKVLKAFAKRPRVDDEMADFIVDGEDERDMGWRSELRKMTNYDPSKSVETPQFVDSHSCSQIQR